MDNAKPSQSPQEQKKKPERKPVPIKNVFIGAVLDIFKITTLGQPFKVLKTHMAAFREHNLRRAFKETWNRGGIKGFYQGLIPWSWIENLTKGSVLLPVQSQVAYVLELNGVGNSVASGVGGMVGGIAQAYSTMAWCTFFTTTEVTKSDKVSSITLAKEVYSKNGISGLYKGVNAVAIRQMTNWGSRFAISRATESIMRGKTDKQLSNFEKIIASLIGGALACWNQPIEVIRVEMQSVSNDPNRKLYNSNASMWSATKFIYKFNGIRGFFRGVIPRVGLSSWATVCMVFGGDKLKEYLGSR